MSRQEWEYTIPPPEGEEILTLCEALLIEKVRYTILSANGSVWEVDEFLGANQGLVMAEIELESENQTIEFPEWIGQEITNDCRYCNANLAQHPFSTW